MDPLPTGTETDPAPVPKTEQDVMNEVVEGIALRFAFQILFEYQAEMKEGEED